MRTIPLPTAMLLALSLTACGDDSTTTDSSTATDSGSSTMCDAASGDGCDSSAASCVAEPCKLVGPQCGCAAGDKCTVFDDATMCFALSTEEPILGAETYCRGEEAWCEAGLFCAQFNVELDAEMCLAFCLSDDDCPTSGRCQHGYLGGPTQDGAPVGVCVPHCNPLDGTGCPAGEPGEEHECRPWREMWICAALSYSPRIAEGDDCEVDATCAPGLRCVESSCRRLCDPAGTECSAGQTCTVGDEPTVFEAVTYGACLPT